MNHIDCKYYLATDVFKGICKRTKDSVNADETACADFDRAPKCRHCLHFSACADFDRAPKCRHCLHFSNEDEYTGKCMGKAIAYPDMKAFTCKDFSWK